MKSAITVQILLVSLNLFLYCEKGAEKKQEDGQTQEQIEIAANIAIDPLCEMKVEKEGAQWTAEHAGEIYYFCIEKHKVSFVQDPDKYLTKE